MDENNVAIVSIHENPTGKILELLRQYNLSLTVCKGEKGNTPTIINWGQEVIVPIAREVHCGNLPIFFLSVEETGGLTDQILGIGQKTHQFSGKAKVVCHLDGSKPRVSCIRPSTFFINPALAVVNVICPQETVSVIKYSLCQGQATVEIRWEVLFQGHFCQTELSVYRKAIEAAFKRAKHPNDGRISYGRLK